MLSRPPLRSAKAVLIGSPYGLIGRRMDMVGAEITEIIRETVQ